MIASPVEVYRRQIEKELKDGNATEHTHRPALKTLLQALAPKITATNEPKRVECGAPDFAVTEKRAHGPVTMGHLEAKDVGKDLDEAQKSEQMKRYLPALPNLILTDYLEFRWYVDGERRETARLARVSKGGKLAPEKDGAQAVTALLTSFLEQKAQPVNSPKELALRMARLTHLIRDLIVAAFDKQAASVTLRDLRNAFEKALIPDLPIPQFADMFAQTLAYGLFAARCNHHGPTGSFKRLGAASEIPKTNPFLRQLFETITGTALDEEPFVGFVDDLAQLLADTDIGAVLADFGKRTARQDPVVHFYETFLAAYDPKLREARGVYYTPEPVVSYLVRSVDYLLKARFGCAGGLADTATIEYERGDVGAIHESPLQKATSPRVLILDPACGTGTFLYAVVDHIRAEFMRQGNAGMWSGYVRSHLLPRIFGFELLMAPYAVAHFKLGMQLAGNDLTPAQREKWAYDFSGDERLGVFLTNTLEEAERRAETLFGPLRVITQEGNAASKIKSELPILAVIGNPPYSGHSANRSWEVKNGKKERTFIGRLIQDYYKVDGQPLGEKNPKWLQDDYVKFIRWGQWRIERTGAGVLAFITNHGYLDNPTFRGMRQQLMNAFSEIYVLDLHGNSKKKERATDGSKDENVFDIQQGVTLGIFIKEPNKPRPAKVYHADLWGIRESKYEKLFESDVNATPWKQLDPQPSLYLFIPQKTGLRAEYDKGWKMTDAMPLNLLGFQTHRDHVATAFDEETLRGQITSFLEESPSVDEWRKNAHSCSYRPFDSRKAYFSKSVCDRPRLEVTGHLFKANTAMNLVRQTKAREWRHALASDKPTPAVFLEIKDGSSIFPLYVYAFTQDKERGQAKLEVQTSHWPAGKDGRRPNLNPEFVADLEKRLGLKFVPDRAALGRGGLRPPETAGAQSSPAQNGAGAEAGAQSSPAQNGAGAEAGAGAQSAPLQETFGPEDVFNYIYAVFHSPTYRSRYAEFLKSDFPRVPLTSDVNLFRSLCGLGGELVALHLLESPKLEKPMARFPVKGSNRVDKGFPRYVAPGEPEPGTGKPPKEGRVYINRSAAVPAADVGAIHESPLRGDAALKGGATSATGGQYFEGVPPEVWNFHIGGYQVCEKWLKDRRGRTLTYDDLEHYAKVVAALSETIRLMAAIDAAIPQWPIE